MQFVAVRNKCSHFLPAIQELYESAFPAPERRRFEKLALLLREPDIHLYVVKQQGELLGLFIYWDLNNIMYLENLAVVPHRRGQGIGKAIMNWLLEQTKGKQLILEVERPHSETTQKRIEFYLKLGLVLHPAFDYYQPPYEPLGQKVPLFLMSLPPLNNIEELSAIADLIRERVYELNY